MSKILFPLVPFLMYAVAAQAQDASPPESGLTLHSTSQEIVLDLVVRDSHGKAVKNLQQRDIEVYEDGVLQKVQSFQYIQGRDVSAAAKTASAVPTSSPVQSVGIGNPLKAVNLICIVFHNLDPFTKKYAVEAAQEFLRKEFPPDAWVTVFNLDSRLTALHAFTQNRNEAIQAASNAITGTGVDFAQVATAILNASPNILSIELATVGNPAAGGTVNATARVAGGTISQQAITGADVSTSAGANARRGEQAAQRREFGAIEGMRERDQMLEMIGQLGTLPGRKSVLLLTPGIASTGDAELFKAMVDKANKASITVYGIDVNGLSAEVDQAQASNTALKSIASLSSGQGKATTSAAQNMANMRQGDYLNDAVRTTNTQASLRELSEATGGFLIGSTNDLRKPFQRIIDEVETHYEVIYHPSSSKYDGRLRSIEVKSGRQELNIQSRTGYFALPVLGTSPDLAPYELAGLAAMSVHQPPHAFEFKSSAYQFRPTVANSQNAISFQIPGANLEFTPEPAQKRHRVHPAIVALVKDASGQVVDKFSQDTPYFIPDENVEAVRKTSVTFTHPIALVPGRYTVEAAVLDREANRSSVSKMEFQSPEVKGVGISSILLVQRLEPVKGNVDAADPMQFQAKPTEGQHVIPELTTALRADAHPYVYFVVYPDKAIEGKPQIQVEFLVGGQVLAKQVADLPPADATGAIPMVIGAAAKPGNCEFRITALQGKSSSVQSLAYNIAAK